MQLDTDGTATTNRLVFDQTASFTLGFSSSAGFAVSDSISSTQFAPSTLSNSTSRPDFFPRVEYKINSASATNFLVVFKEPNATPAIAERYTATGAWQQNTAAGTSTRVKLDYFSYCNSTSPQALPVSGVKTYRWFGTANYAEDRQLYFAQAAGTLTVDFSNRTFSTNVGLSGTDFLGGNFGGLTNFDASGNLVGSSARVVTSSTRVGQSGSMQLQLCGPNAEEVIFTYAGFSPSYTFVGSAAGVSP